MQDNHDITVTGYRSEILTWLSPLEPHLRHHDIRTKRVKDVGDWLLGTEEFRSWRNGHRQDEPQKSTIFCSGNLGVGKTYISSLVIDTLCDEPREGGEDIAVACFYFDSKAQKEQSAASVLGALVRQAVGGFKQIPKEVTDSFQRHKKFIGGRELQLPEIVKMLGSLSSTQPTFLCLDAIDECTALDRANILFSLRDIIEMSPTTRVFLTGRPHVGREVEKHFPERTALVPISPQNGDIIRYIHKKLAQDTNSGEMDEELEEEIVKKFLENFSEIFLLVALNLDAILQEITIRLRREKLQVMTDGLGLGDAYGPTLDRVKGQGSHQLRLGMTALVWICHSERPLGPEELCEALGVEIGSAECNGDRAPSIRTVLSCCQGLVVVDKEGSTARLVHYTLQEYLTSHRNLFQSPHSTIAETCLTYLNSQRVMALSSSLAPSSQRPPFLKYSSLYWGVHMKKDPSGRGKTLALRFFNHYECHISIRLLWRHTLGWHSPRLIDYRFTGLHHASMFGLVEVARALIEMDGVDKNGIDVTGGTPLLWAAKSGHEAVAKLLLGYQDVNPNRPDRVDRTPISWAAGNGHEAVVKLLLGWEGVKPDRPDTWDRTPISWAAQNGHEAVVNLLLGTDLSPDRPDRNGRTPTSWAAKNGHEAVVKLFLEREDISPDRPDHKGETPILLATGNNREGVVKLLLGRKDVNPDRSNSCGLTPIMWATLNNHEALVELLLRREDVTPDKPDFYGGTPMSFVAWNGYEAIMKLLLGRGDVNPDRPNCRGQTPISLAARKGHEVVVKLLLEREGVNPNTPDWYDRTAISWAAENGHVAVARLLLEREDISPDRPDSHGRTPISWAAKNGHEAVVKLLLRRKDVNPDRLDPGGRTPISWAAKNGHDAIVRLLIWHKGVNSDRPDKNGQTPISLAARKGHVAVVELLAFAGNANPSTLDDFGRTRILLATQGNDEEASHLPLRMVLGAWA